jgi:anti-sigma-K factor RskA
MTEISHEQWRDDLAAYLLGSLSESEAKEVETHVEGCRECREQLRWLRPALEVLPESVEPVEPDPQLRARIMADIEDDLRGAPSTERPRPQARRTRFRLWALRPAVGLAAVLVVIAGVVGFTVGGDSGDNTETITSQSGVQAKLERMGDSGTLELASLRQLPPGRVYQAWVKTGKKVDPSSLFVPKADGTATAGISENLNGADEVMVTVEPQGGSPYPTSPPVARVQLN